MALVVSKHSKSHSRLKGTRDIFLLTTPLLKSGPGHAPIDSGSGPPLDVSFLRHANIANFQHWAILVGNTCYEVTRRPPIRHRSRRHISNEFCVNIVSLRKWIHERERIGIEIRCSRVGVTKLPDDSIREEADFIWQERFKTMYQLDRQNCQNFAWLLRKRILVPWGDRSVTLNDRQQWKKMPTRLTGLKQAIIVAAVIGGAALLVTVLVKSAPARTGSSSSSTTTKTSDYTNNAAKRLMDFNNTSSTSSPSPSSSTTRSSPTTRSSSSGGFFKDLDREWLESIPAVGNVFSSGLVGRSRNRSRSRRQRLLESVDRAPRLPFQTIPVDLFATMAPKAGEKDLVNTMAQHRSDEKLHVDAAPSYFCDGEELRDWYACQDELLPQYEDIVLQVGDLQVGDAAEMGAIHHERESMEEPNHGQLVKVEHPDEVQEEKAAEDYWDLVGLLV